MEATRLRKDELEYELRVRGVANVQRLTTFFMRKELQKRFNTETAVDLPNNPLMPLDPVQEVDICTEKLILLQGLCKNFSGTTTSLPFLKIIALAQHLISRLARIENCEDADLRTAIANLQDRVRQEEDNVLELCDEAESRLRGDDLPAPVAVKTEAPVAARRQIPVARWDLTFSGEDDLSINAFLERVEDFRISRHVSETELCESIIELLKGRALTWYRSVCSRIVGWADLYHWLVQNMNPLITKMSCGGDSASYAGG